MLSGDTDENIKKDLDRARAAIDGKEIDVFVCAAHAYGKTVDLVTKTAGHLNGYFLGEIGTDDNALPNFLNDRDAELLLRAIEAALNDKL